MIIIALRHFQRSVGGGYGQFSNRPLQSRSEETRQVWRSGSSEGGSAEWWVPGFEMH
jgi:hypothetical protein